MAIESIDKATSGKTHVVILMIGLNYLLWGYILPYPKDGLVQTKHILRVSSLEDDNFSFLTRHLTDRLQAENG